MHHLDHELATLAARQHGIVATWQLKSIGYTRHEIEHRAKTRRLHRLMRGVYAVGHTKISLRGRWMAAVLACGPGAVLSHRAAAALWQLQAAPSGPIDVTAPSRHNLVGVRCHTARALHPEDVAKLDGIPVTSVSRTLLDLAEVLHIQRLRSLLEAAQRLELLDFRAFDRLCARSNGRRGLGRLRRALSELADDAPWTQSELERRFLELVRGAGLPEPRANIVVDGAVVDFYWPERELIIEVDGYRFHRTRGPFEDDRRRDARHAVAGRRVIRVTRKRMLHERHALVDDLQALISGGRARGGSGQ